MSTQQQLLEPLAIFRNRNFAVMWSALLITETGTAVSSMASFLLVYRLTESVFSTGLMMVATILPSLLFGLVAGVVVDRTDRRRLMITTELVRAVLLLCVPLLLGNGIIWLYGVILAVASLGQFFNPAFYSVLPDIAGDDELGAANSLLSVSQYGAIALGSAVGGFLVAYLPIEWAYYLDAATFLVSAGLISRLRLGKARPSVTAAQSVGQNVLAGLRFVAGKPTLRSLFLVFIPIGITYGFVEVIRLPFILTELGGTELDYGILDSLTVVGMVVAGLLMTLYSRRRRDGQWIVLSSLAGGLVSIAFAFSGTVGTAILFAMLEGFMYAPTAIAASLIIERNTPRHIRGRAFGAFFVVRDSMFMIGMLLAGLGDIFDLRLLYFLSGVVVFATGVAAHFMPGLGQSLDRWLRGRLPSLDAWGVADPAAARSLEPAEWNRLLQIAPGMCGFSPAVQTRVYDESQLLDVPQGAAIIRQDDTSDAAYFLLDGSVTAMRRLGEEHEVLEVLTVGDFFGEIAALTGSRRTADVIATAPSSVVSLPATLWCDLAAQPGFGDLIDETVGERLTRLGGCDAALPGRYDYRSLQALREEAPVAPG